MLRDTRNQSNDNDNSNTDCDSSSDLSINSSGSETSAATARNGKTLSSSNTLFSDHPQGTTNQCKEDHDVEKLLKKCLTLEDGLITKKQATQINDKVDLMYNKILQLTSKNKELRKMQRKSQKMNEKLKNQEHVMEDLIRTVQESKG
mgnify:CR=1 FL=1